VPAAKGATVADDNNTPEPQFGDDTDAPIEEEPTSETSDSEDAADEPEPAGVRDSEMDQLWSTLETNSQVRGELVVHFPDRDVRVAMDGLSALRVLTCFARQNSQLSDSVSPRSPGENDWFAVDLAKALAISWNPRDPKDGLDAPVAFDPPVI
jgi:hypothetical protein